jgi:hypothetical protein
MSDNKIIVLMVSFFRIKCSKSNEDVLRTGLLIAKLESCFRYFLYLLSEISILFIIKMLILNKMLCPLRKMIYFRVLT